MEVTIQSINWKEWNSEKYPVINGKRVYGDTEQNLSIGRTVEIEERSGKNGLYWSFPKENGGNHQPQLQGYAPVKKGGFEPKINQEKQNSIVSQNAYQRALEYVIHNSSGKEISLVDVANAHEQIYEQITRVAKNEQEKPADNPDSF